MLFCLFSEIKIKRVEGNNTITSHKIFICINSTSVSKNVAAQQYRKKIDTKVGNNFIPQLFIIVKEIINNIKFKTIYKAIVIKPQFFLLF